MKQDRRGNARQQAQAVIDRPTRQLGLTRSRELGTDDARTLGAARRLGMRGRGDPRPNLAELFKHQVEAVYWLRGLKRCLLADDMGCVDGDAIVRVCRAGKSFELPLAELCARFHGSTGWDPAITTHVRVLAGDTFRLHPIENVLDRGVRPVVKIMLESGKGLRVTPDHEVCTEADGHGRYVEASQLRPGDSVCVNGQAVGVCPLCNRKVPVTTPAAKFPGHCRSCIYRKLRTNHLPQGGKYLDCDGYVRVSGQQEHHRAGRGGFVYEHILVAEKMLGRPILLDEAVHHKNHDRQDNRPENLAVLTVSEHASQHGRENGFRKLDGSVSAKGGRVVFVPKLDRVVSVHADGVAHVYDIVCSEPHRNFVANGIVVHNCGKTAALLRALPSYPRCIAVCPASVQLVWRQQAQRWRPDLRVAVGEGLRKPDEGEIVIVSIDSLPDPPSGSKKLLLDDLSEVILIGDEIHMAMNGKAARTQRWRRLAWQCGQVWGATGTPMLGKPENLWGVLVSLGLTREVFPGGWEEFVELCHGKKRFFRVRGVLQQRGWEWGTIDPEVQRRLREKVMLRRMREEVLPDLPRRQYVDVPCAAPADLREFLDEKKEVWDALDQGELPPFELMSEARAALAASRIPAAVEYVRNMAGSMPLLVFSAHRAPVIAVGEMKGVEGGVGVLMGDTPMKERARVVEAFQAGELRVLAMTIDAGGVGLTLTAAGGVVFVDRDYTPAMNDQAEARAVRPGQAHQSVMVVRLMSDHPLDVRLNEILDSKREQIAQAVGG